MRRTLVLTLLAALTTCSGSSYVNTPPVDRLYFPSGIVHMDVPGSTDGVLFVSNANFDKRFTSGNVLAVRLDDVSRADGGVGLPAFGTQPAGGPEQFPNLGNDGGAATNVHINTFAGELVELPLSTGRSRLFVPSRSEGMKFQAIDVTISDAGEVAMSCFPAAPSGSPLDCATNAPSTSPTALEQSVSGIPRAPVPFGVAVSVRSCATDADCSTDGIARTCAMGSCKAGSDPFADVYVTSLSQADSPLGSGLDLLGYVSRFESDQMTVSAANFVTLSAGATNSAISGKRWTYLSGRYTTPFPSLLRLVDKSNTVLLPGLESTFGVLDTRGIALGHDEGKVFIAGRSPDVLLEVIVSGPTADLPGLRVSRAVPLPNAPQQVRVVHRAGRGDLVFITCSGGGALAIYDEDVGDLVAQVGQVGLQPFGLAIDQRGAGVRVFVGDFNDGRIAVIDVPDLNVPQDARLVAHVGVEQLCLVKPTQTANCTTTTGVLP